MSSIQNLGQRLIVNVSKGLVKETGAYVAAGVNHRRMPWRVTERRNGLHFAKANPKVPRDPAQFVGALDNKSRLQVGLIDGDQSFNLCFQLVDLPQGQSDLVPLTGRPILWMIERGRGQDTSPKKADAGCESLSMICVEQGGAADANESSASVS